MRKIVQVGLIVIIISCPLAVALSDTAADTASGPPAMQSPHSADEKTPPKILQKVQPAYPPEAREKGIQGIVVLQVVVDKTGQAESIHVKSGDPLLAPAAVDAVRQWRWEPTIVGNQPVSVTTKITVNFKLADLKKKE